jgi:hypothetical protein
LTSAKRSTLVILAVRFPFRAARFAAIFAALFHPFQEATAMSSKKKSSKKPSPTKKPAPKKGWTGNPKNGRRS